MLKGDKGCEVGDRNEHSHPFYNLVSNFCNNLEMFSQLCLNLQFHLWLLTKMF